MSQTSYPVPEIRKKDDGDVGLTVGELTLWASEIGVLEPRNPDNRGQIIQRIALFFLLKVDYLFEMLFHFETVTSK